MADGTLSIINTTIANNYAPFSGGMYIENNATVNLTNTLVANNTSDGDGPNIDNFGTINSLGNSLIADTTGTRYTPNANDIVGSNASPVNALIGSLTNNGGFTETHALLSGSPAIDAGFDFLATTTDQRGEARFGQSDIGAYEVANCVPGDITPPVILSLIHI